ncbi:MAG: RNA 3'-terminal phosphate cyclase [Planctomycetota bacterium]
MRSEVAIDGSAGEGGGQILRSALALSLLTGRPFRIEKIRAGRRKPGLLRQHLTAVEAAAAVGGARVEGAAIGSSELRFAPHEVRAGEHRFSVGTAGSATLVLETVLPALAVAEGPSRLVLEGGTHNPFAPPFDFLAKAFLPILARMGVEVEARLERPGFYPAGGGRMEVRVRPAPRLRRLEILERGAVRRKSARALVARLPREIGEREVRKVAEILGLSGDDLEVEEVRGSAGPGNAVIVEIESEAVTEVFSAFGERGVPAEAVGEKPAREALRYLEAGVPVGEHLADQLLLPMAIAGGGAFRTLAPTAHARTNAEVLRMFLDVEVRFEEEGQDAFLIELSGRGEKPE